MYMDDISLFGKMEKNWISGINNKNIQPEYKNGIYYR